jgi:hypothetical protein
MTRHDEIGGLTFDNCQILLRIYQGLDRSPIERTVSLSAWALDGGAFAAVKEAELNASSVGCTTHKTVKRINFAHQMPFTQTANGGVTGHDANSFGLMCHQRGSRTRTGSSGSGLCACMPASNNDDVEI